MKSNFFSTNSKSKSCYKNICTGIQVYNQLNTFDRRTIIKVKVILTNTFTLKGLTSWATEFAFLVANNLMNM
jgi:sRNA-binding regulator protein Hfq